MDAETRRKCVRLRYTEKIRLCDWLRCQRERIEADKIGPSALAREIAADPKLNLPLVNKDHVRTALRACEMPVLRDRRAGGKASGENRRLLLARIDALEARCVQLEARCRQAEDNHAALVKLVEETADRLQGRYTIENGRPTGPRR